MGNFHTYVYSELIKGRNLHRNLFCPDLILRCKRFYSPCHRSSPTGASLSHKKWMKSYSFALTLTCSKFEVKVLKTIQKWKSKNNLKYETLYGVGLSLLMWSDRICSSCLMHRSLMSFKGGRISSFLSSKE